MSQMCNAPCPICGNKMFQATGVDKRGSLYVSCLQLPKDRSSSKEDTNYHSYSYTWYFDTHKIEEVRFSFLYYGKKLHCEIDYVNGMTCVGSGANIIFNIPRIIEPDFPQLISFQEKLKKLITFA